MSDTTGLWTAVGAVIGVVGVQLGGITQAVIASRARKAEAAAAEKASRGATQRPLYEQMIADLDKAAEYIAWILQTIENPGKGPGGGAAAGLREVLGPLRSACVAIQIDGSERAEYIATGVLGETGDLWQEVTERKTIFSTPALGKAHKILTLGHAAMIDVSRGDIGV